MYKEHEKELEDIPRANGITYMLVGNVHYDEPNHERGEAMSLRKPASPNIFDGTDSPSLMDCLTRLLDYQTSSD